MSLVVLSVYVRIKEHNSFKTLFHLNIKQMQYYNNFFFIKIKHGGFEHMIKNYT